jgi:hypothetical protein
MKLISLGGVGGCIITNTLDSLYGKTERYPYNWVYVSQSFVLDSFLNFNNFFEFEEKRLVDNTCLLAPNNNGLMYHDFIDFTLEKNDVIQKYKRRYNRLEETLNTNEPILFIRKMDSIIDNPNKHFIYIKEDCDKWIPFIKNLSIKYNKKIGILLVSENIDDYNKNKDSFIKNEYCYMRYAANDNDWKIAISYTFNTFSELIEI